MPTLYFPAKHKELVEDLCTNSASPELISVFPRYRDLMLFAAMVGKKFGASTQRVGQGGEVESNYFSSPNFNKEGVVFLLGLLETEDPSVLKGGAQQCWKLFEQYCAGGMDIIAGWLKTATGPEEYATLIQEKTLEMARATKKVEVKVKKPKISRVG